jgi:hypothetical protein
MIGRDREQRQGETGKRDLVPGGIGVNLRLLG